MTTIKIFWSQLKRTWCSLAHPSPLWPIHGEYRCPECFRVYPVGWESSMHRPARPAH
jgi:hypothetical protein